MKPREDVPVPLRLQRLPRDERGFAVPWFVHWQDGVPDYRVIGAGKIDRAVAGNRCWICGDRLGRNLAFVIGPMCAVNRVSAEPPSHRECALYAVQVCPFLSQPRMRRNDKNMPTHVPPPGLMIERNPGVAAVWLTRDYRLFAARRGWNQNEGPPGKLLHIGEPLDVLWFREGRRARRREVTIAMMTGLPALMEVATSESAAAVEALKDGLHCAMRWLPDEDDEDADAGSVVQEAERPEQPVSVAVEVSIATS